MRVTWHRPRLFSGLIFAGFWDMAPVHLCTKFQFSISTRFGDTLGCTPKFMGSLDLDHAPFLNFSLPVFEILPLCTCVPNFKSLSLLTLEIHWGVRQQILGVTWSRLRPYSGFFFAGFWDIAALRLCKEFRVSSSTHFRDTLGCTPKFMGSRDLGHAPFLDFLCRFLRYCRCASMYQISSL